MQDQMAAMQQNSAAMGEAFDASQERRLVLSAAGGVRQRGLPTRDGAVHLARRKSGAVHHLPRGRSRHAEGIAHIDAIKKAAKEAIKGTPLEGSKVYLGGTASMFKDMSATGATTT